ncbi:MAG: methylmalonyl Co-A mutase-associated GTPase MeaB [Saprospiraceae bacterium]
MNRPFHRKQKRDLAFFLEGISQKNKFVLAEAITLVESSTTDDKILSEQLLTWVYDQKAPSSMRIAVTGSPGSGKSTFIDYLGSSLANVGHHVAVLTIDPSSSTSKGSILGDKTRMETLLGMDNVFVRPSPSGNILGGVAPHTKEAILLCEAAGFDRILIETVGVGQSEVEVSYLTDVNVFILQPGAGDDLQGIKRGILENMDIVVVNKSDGTQKDLAKETANYYGQSFSLFHHPMVDWKIPVHLVSSLEKIGLSDVLLSLDRFEQLAKSKGTWTFKRRQQEIKWFQKMIPTLLLKWAYTHPSFTVEINQIEKELSQEEIHAVMALREVEKSIQKIFGI